MLCEDLKVRQSSEVGDGAYDSRHSVTVTSKRTVDRIVVVAQEVTVAVVPGHSSLEVGEEDRESVPVLLDEPDVGESVGELDELPVGLPV